MLPVTKNLYGALNHLRNEHTERDLWVDAICINQDNIKERNYQVTLMKNIFQKSRNTVVWLGEESANSEGAIQLVKELARISLKTTTYSRFYRVWNREVRNLPPLYDPAWRAFEDLLQRPWFHRAWIIQEVSVARDVTFVTGDSSLHWDELFRAIDYAIDLGTLIALGGSAAWQALNLYGSRSRFQQSRLPSLLDTLVRNRSFHATDPRDKVFGLLSLADAKDVQTLGVSPSYQISVEELYQKLAVSFLKKGEIRVLGSSGLGDHRADPKVPSWVPDWSISTPTIPLVSNEAFAISAETLNPSPVFYASGDSSLSFDINESGHVLGMEGFLVDEVAEIGAVARTRYFPKISHMYQLFAQGMDVLNELKNWEGIAQIGSKSRYVTGEKRFNAYWQTLCAGHLPLGFKSAIRDPRWKYYLVSRSMRPIVRFLVHFSPKTEKTTALHCFFYALFQVFWRITGLTPTKFQRIGFPPESRLSNHRRMIRTTKGYIGLMPQCTQVGDCIGIFKGVKMPLVVRKDGSHYVIIGESYVHGMMKGEVWNEKEVHKFWFR